MTELPSGIVATDSAPLTTPPDSATGGYPGFMGEYLVRDVGSWWAVEGNQSNELASASGACSDERATFDWAQFSCEAASFRFEWSAARSGCLGTAAVNSDPGPMRERRLGSALAEARFAR